MPGAPPHCHTPPPCRISSSARLSEHYGAIGTPTRPPMLSKNSKNAPRIRRGTWKASTTTPSHYGSSSCHAKIWEITRLYHAIHRVILPPPRPPPHASSVSPTPLRSTPSGFPIGERDALVLLLPLLRRLVASVQLHGRPAHVPLDERVLVPGSFVQKRNTKTRGTTSAQFQHIVPQKIPQSNISKESMPKVGGLHDVSQREWTPLLFNGEHFRSDRPVQKMHGLQNVPVAMPSARLPSSCASSTAAVSYAVVRKVSVGVHRRVLVFTYTPTLP